MARIRLIATDLDGTLLHSTYDVSEYTVDVLRRAQDKGAHVVPVTARAPWSATSIAGDFGMRGYAIFNSGATIYDLAENAVIEQWLLDHEQALEMVDAMRKALPGIAFACARGEMYAREPSYPVGEPPPVPHRVGDAREWLTAPVHKLVMKHPSSALDQILTLARDLAGESAHITTTGGTFVEMLASGASKLGALERLCARLKVARDEVIAFGDWPNDIPMIQWAGLGVAPANAHDEVLAAADEVCAPNDDDGVARTIDRLLEEGKI